MYKIPILRDKKKMQDLFIMVNSIEGCKLGSDGSGASENGGAQVSQSFRTQTWNFTNVILK
jgi:hypothetical protein